MTLSCLRLPFLVGLVLVGVLLQGCEEKNTQQDYLASGKAYLESGDAAAAVIQLKNAVRVNPERGEDRYWLAVAIARTGDLTEAEIAFRKALELSDNRDKVELELLSVLAEYGDTKKLLAEIENAKVTDSKAKGEVLGFKAAALLALGKVDAAREAADAALRLAPDGVRGVVALARLTAMTDRTKALEMLDAAVKRDPRAFPAVLAKADILNSEGRSKEAIAAYQQAVALRPLSTEANIPLVPLLVAEKRLDEAAAAVKHLRTLAPAGVMPSYLEAIVAYANGEKSKARDLIRQVLKVLPDDVRALTVASEIDLSMGNESAARRSLERAVTLLPREPYLRFLLARSHLRGGSHIRAAEVLDPVLRGGTKHAELHLLAGEVAEAGKQFEKAREQYKLALVKDPGNKMARLRYAQASLQGGDVSQAIQDLKALTADKDVSAAAHTALIRYYLSKSQASEAAAAASAFREQQPANPEAHYMQGLIYATQQNNKNARLALEKALEIDGAYVPAAAALAQLDVRDGNSAAAQARYRGVLQKDPKSEEAALLLVSLMINGNAPREEVLKVIDGVIATGEASGRLSAAKIGFLMSRGDHRAAADAATQALAQSPDDAKLLEALARAQHLLKEYTQAITTYGKLIAITPNSALPYLGQAETYFALSDWQSAQAALNKAIEANPDYVPAYMTLVNQGIRLGKLDDALRTAKKMQQRWPSNALGYISESHVHAARKNHPQAEAALREGLARTNDGQLVVVLYQYLGDSAKKAEAEAVVASWLAKNRKHTATVAASIGDSAVVHKKLDDAERWYRTGLKSQPNNPVLMNNLAWVLGQLGRTDEALALGNRALELFPGTAAILDTLGEIYVGKGEFDKGIDLLKQAASVSPASAATKLKLAKALIKAGRRDEARQQLEAARSQPSSPAVKKEIASLLEAR